MPYREVRGTSLYFEDTGGGGPAVLLLHELGGSSESWRAVMALLAPRFRAIAMDYRCAGRSEKPTSVFELSDLADDAAGLLTALGIREANVIGAAMGSLVGALLAGRHPALVRRLAMAAVADDVAGVTADYLTARAARVRTEGMRPVAEASLKNAFPEGFAAQREAYRPIYLANDPAGYAELSLALARARLDQGVWDAVGVPVLVASGAHDFIWPPELGRRTAGRIAGAGFAELTAAGHFPHLQTPEALVALCQGFFVGDGVL